MHWNKYFFVCSIHSQTFLETQLLLNRLYSRIHYWCVKSLKCQVTFESAFNRKLDISSVNSSSLQKKMLLFDIRSKIWQWSCA